MDKSSQVSPTKCVEQLAISQPPEKSFNFNAIFKPQGIKLQPSSFQEESLSKTSIMSMPLQPKLVISTPSQQSFPNITTWAKKSSGAESVSTTECKALVHAILVSKITSDVMTTISDRAQRLDCYTIDVGPDIENVSRIFRFFDARHAAEFQFGLINNPWFKSIQAQSHYDTHMNVMVFSVSSSLWPQIENDLLHTLEEFGEVCLLQNDPANVVGLHESLLVGNQETIVCKFWDMRDMHKLQSAGSVWLKSGFILTPICVSVNPVSLHKLSQIWTPLSTPLSTTQESVPPPTPQLMPQVMSPLSSKSFSLDQKNRAANIPEHKAAQFAFQPPKLHQGASEPPVVSQVDQSLSRGTPQRRISQAQVIDRKQFSFQGNVNENITLPLLAQEVGTKAFAASEPFQSAYSMQKVGGSYKHNDTNNVLLNGQHNFIANFESSHNQYSSNVPKSLSNAMLEMPLYRPQPNIINPMNQQISRLGPGSMWKEFTTRPVEFAPGGRNGSVFSEPFESQLHYSGYNNRAAGNSFTSSPHPGHRYGAVDSVSSISSMSSTESQTSNEFADECAALFKRFSITKPVDWPASPPPSPPLKQATPMVSRKVRRSQQVAPTFLKYDATGSSEHLETHIDLEAIDSGTEKRCTVMVRNIPNKLEFDEFKAFMDVTSQGCYDFLYLRFDFTNRCNVGYAFVSFTDPVYVKEFVQKRSGMNWKELNHNSGKIVDLRYAKIQGHFNLVQKFRNSPVMTQEQSFRPRFYHTSGPLKGKEIEFDSSS